MKLDRESLIQHYHFVRAYTEMLCSPLEREDYAVQPAEFVSPPKWHLGHTTWFFEAFILSPYIAGYNPYHNLYQYVFNSYYEALGQRVERARRGALSRPTVDEVQEYRSHVDMLVPGAILSVPDTQLGALAETLELGLQHEQQHQELLLMDVKYILGKNPLMPAYHDVHVDLSAGAGAPDLFLPVRGGVASIGYAGAKFCFDNEHPAHDVLIRDFQLRRGLVTNAEYLSFVEQDGYKRHDLWLSDGWTIAQRDQWRAPLYWELIDGAWHEYTLGGLHPLDFDAPVCHVSYYEADAYAKFRGCRLPTEQEWEIATQQYPPDEPGANLLENGRYHPMRVSNGNHADLQQMLGDAWQWTSSSYLPYPGYKPYAGLLAEYNGKFMVNQMVLRGGSCATPREHIRTTYRNFFQPEMRWQFSGIRLAKDA